MKRLLSILVVAALFVAPGPALARAQGAPPASVKPPLPRGSAAGPYQRRSLERLLAGSAASVESLDVIVFRVSFADKDFDAAHDTTYFDNELRHVREYYLGASRNVFHMKTTLFPTVVKLSGTEAYYGNADLWKERMAELLIEVVQKTDADVDFSRYDAYAVIHADAGRETDFNNDSQYQIASGFVDPQEMAAALKDTLGTPGVPTNDRVNGDTLFIDNLMVWPEEASQDGYTFGSLGIYAYQVGLRLGMIPLFDTTPEGFPDSQGLGNFDLMSYGIYNALGFVPAFPSAFNRLLMGWVTPVVVGANESVRIADINSALVSDTALVKISLNPSEYFLVENRVHDTNFNGRFDFIDLNGDGIPENEDTLRGAEFDFFLTATTDLRVKPDSVVTGSGLMVYHVDEAAIRAAIEAGGAADDDKNWKGVDLEEADHIQDLDSPGGAFAFGSFYDSFRKDNNDRFGPDTDPSSADNAGVKTGIVLDEISSAGHYMTFRASFSPPKASVRGEFPADIARLSPIAVPSSGSDHERLLLAADSAGLYVADAGLAGWDGTVEKLPIENGGVWTAPPIIGFTVDKTEGEMYLTSSVGILHAYDWSGGPVAIDDDGTQGTLKLHGDAASSLIRGSGNAGVLAFSSTADSTYLMILTDDGASPGTGWVRRGSIGFEIGLMKGQIVSHPAAGIIMSDDGGSLISGEYIATYDVDRGLCFNFMPIATRAVISPLHANGAISIDPANIITMATGIRVKPAGLLTISTGDIDRDGSDEMVAAIDNAGLYYYKAGGAVHHISFAGSRFSPPVLADIDGDGTLETALRDESHCYLFSGFGVPVSGWPHVIDMEIAAHEGAAPPSPSVVDDVNGDGAREVVFLVGGDIHAFDFRGREIKGYPLAGEGARGGALAIMHGESDRLYILDCAAALPYSRDAGTGAASGAVSSIRRYDTGVDEASTDQVWRMYRHDSYGYGRQDNGGSAPNPHAERIDPSTFMIYPNPATGGHVTVRVVISAPARVKVTLVNLEGEKVAAVERDHAWFRGSAVPFEETFSTAKLAGGVYLCRLEVAGDGWSWTGSKKFAVTR
ncbi:MAG: T9SS type A sorting domain-containing protein [Candidatus Krumholzibacteriaceae bacterium]